MTTNSPSATRTQLPPHRPPGRWRGGITPVRVLRSEWVKLHSLRSSTAAVLSTAATLIAGAAFTAVGIIVKHTPPAAEAIAADPSGGTLSGVELARLSAILIGVLCVTAEYRPPMILNSLAAVPTRHHLVVGKATVVGVVTTVASLVALQAAFLVNSIVVGTEGLAIHLTAQGVIPAMVAAALGLGLTATLASGVGWLFRNTTAAVLTLLAVHYVLPSLAAQLPSDLHDRVGPLLPGNIVAAAYQGPLGQGTLPTWFALTLYAAYAVATLTAAALVLHRRDA